MKNTGSIIYDSAYVYKVNPQNTPDTKKCQLFFELRSVNTDIIIKDDSKLQSKPHLDCIICQGQIVINNANTNANLFPIYFFCKYICKDYCNNAKYYCW